MKMGSGFRVQSNLVYSRFNRYTFSSSMAISTSLVKATIVNLVDKATEVPKWVLTSFNDPAVYIAKVTENPEELKSAVQGLSFVGGLDTPEQALQGFKDSQYHVLAFIVNKS